MDQYVMNPGAVAAPVSSGAGFTLIVVLVIALVSAGIVLFVGSRISRWRARREWRKSR